MNFSFENDNAQTAYIAFGSATPVGTYVVTDGVTVYNNGTIAQVGETINLNSSTVFEVASGQTLSGVDVEQFVSGKFLVSLGEPLANTTGTAFQYGSGGDSNTRWDKIEASLYQPGSSNTNSVDLTATDFIGLNFTVQDIRSGSTVGTLQSSSESLAQTFADIATAATNPTSAAEKYAVITGSAGLWVPALNENVLRIIAPSTVPAVGLPAYTTLDGYLSSVESTLGTTGTIAIAGRYEGGGSTATTEDQAYSFSASFDSAGDLILVSQQSTIISDPGATTGIGAGNTIVIANADLQTGLLGDNPSYTVDGAASDIGVNDVYAAAVTNILGGFDLGFIESSSTNPNTQLAFQDTSSASWYYPQLSDSYAYAYAQPDNSTFYDQYGAILAKLGNAYGFPFSDLLQGVQLTPLSGDTVKIIINADSTSSGGGGGGSGGGGGGSGGSSASVTVTNPSNASGAGAAFTTSVTNAGSITIFNGSGNASVAGPAVLTASNVAVTVSGGTTALVDDSNGNNAVTVTKSAIVFATSGDTVSASSGATTLFGASSGQTTFSLGGSGASVTGGSGSILGTSTGANSTLVGGTGVSLFTVTGAGSTAVAGSAGVTGINEAQAAGPEVIATNPLGNTGQLVAILGSGASTVVGGSGSATITGGSGPDAYLFVKGHAGGSEVIIGFKATDNIGFAGYGYTPAALPAEHVGSTGDVMTLSDGTSITFAGYHHTLF
jgi:hypothetical protein